CPVCLIPSLFSALVRSTGLRHGPVAGSSEDLDDEVDHIAGLDETFLNLPPASFLREQVLVFSGGHLIEKIHMGLQNRPKSQRLRDRKSTLLNSSHVCNS